LAVVLTQGEEVHLQRDDSITPDIPWRPTYWLHVLPVWN